MTHHDHLDADETHRHGEAHHSVDGHDHAALARHATRQMLGGTMALALSIIVFGMTFSGRFTNYVQPWFKPWLFPTAAVIAALGLWTLLVASDLREAAGEAATAVDVHSHGVPTVAALLVVPVLTFVVCAPNSLGAAAANNQSPARVKLAGVDPVKFTPLKDRDVNVMTVQDLSDRFVWGEPEQLVGKRVRVTGFVAQPVGKPYWTVNRFRIFCCAADATLFSVGVKDADLPPGKEVWVEVTGRFDLDASTEVPVLVPEDVVVVPTPAEPYL